MSDETTKLQAVGDFIGKLTPRSLLLGVLAGFFALGLYNLYENRAAAFLYIINSPSLLVGLAGGSGSPGVFYYNGTEWVPAGA